MLQLNSGKRNIKWIPLFVERQWVLCVHSDVEYQYISLQLDGRLIINLEQDQSILAAVARGRLHLRVTVFSSHNTSVHLYFEKKARPVYTAFLLLPPARVWLHVLWMFFSCWLKRDHVDNVSICVESFSLVSRFIYVHNEPFLQERGIKCQINKNPHPSKHNNKNQPQKSNNNKKTPTKATQDPD